MQLVEFETNQGTRVWLNPDHVVMAGTHPGLAGVTDILIAGLGHKPVSVKGAPVDVVKKLNDNSKA